MSIATSTIISQASARGGTRLVFQHMTNTGQVLGPFVEQRPAAEDSAAFLVTHAAAMTTSCTAAEVTENMMRFEDGFAPVFNWSTAGNLRQRIRNEFQIATGLRACNMAKRILAFGFTDAQLKALFGINDAQLGTLKTKLAAMETKYDNIVGEAGQ